MNLDAVKLYLSLALEGKVDMPDELIEEFGERCKDVLRRKFKPKEEAEDHLYRMSEVGRPLCQQQMKKAGVEGENSSYNTSMKFLIGDIIEAAAITILKASGTVIDAEQQKLEREVEGIHLQGHLDIVVDGKVYDIKSCSKYAFQNTYNRGNDGFQKLVEDDPFGYLVQGYLYGDSAQKKFGGWIAICKETGEWAVLTPPAVDNAYQKQALATAENNIAALAQNKPFERCFQPEEEVFYKKRTGNYILPRTCQFCGYKQKCWENEGLTYTENPRSKAEYKTKQWYVGTIV
jgi:hypothetical protein